MFFIISIIQEYSVKSGFKNLGCYKMTATLVAVSTRVAVDYVCNVHDCDLGRSVDPGRNRLCLH